MKIKTSEFVTSANSMTNIPERRLAEIAISGRSNVGKSSLINSILNRKALARTSSTPGKTRLLNYFLINDNFYLVDLPGYGYAKVSNSEQNKWKKFIEEYFKNSEDLKLVLQLVDMRHKLKDNDKVMIEFLEYFEIPYIILLTKSDKLKLSERKKQTKYYKEIFEDNLIITSATKGIGKNEVLNKISEYI